MYIDDSITFNMNLPKQIESGMKRLQDIYNKWKYVHPLLLNIKEDEMRIYDAA